MLYPLSYEGARGQSSDLRVTWGGREWPTFARSTWTPVRPAQGHSSSTRNPACDHERLR
jgi:hypothetical protein